MAWQLRIDDPSGETRITPIPYPIEKPWVLGRAETCEVILRDPTLPKEAAVLIPNEIQSQSPFWLKTPSTLSGIRLGDMTVREALIPEGVPIYLGESKVILEEKRPSPTHPTFPPGYRSWKTSTEEGRSLLWTTKKAAETPLSIYLTGETGTGKEVIAHLIHGWSPRRSGPFIPINCGALPLSLAESELFGHIKGSFTGATHHRTGALMQAHGGTLFLDEIGDLTPDIQVKLLRFLENGEIRPIGSDHCTKADVRLICATHRNLSQLVAEGKFRQDLYYRIASICIEIPNLRSRPSDISLLARSFASELGKTLSPKALLRLQAHEWRGNVRELRHSIERAAGLSGTFTSTLDEEAFEFLFSLDPFTHQSEMELGSPVLSLSEMERVLLLKALKLSHGNRTRAAKILGVARSTLFEMLKRHRIQGPKTNFQAS